MHLTPSTAYEGSPINNRFVLIIFSCIGIPLTWIFAYAGLYFYFADDEPQIAFYPTEKEFIMSRFIIAKITKIYQKKKSK